MTVLPPSVPVAAGRPAPLRAFTADLLLAAGILLLVSLAAGIAWGALRGVMLSLEAAKSGQAAASGADLAARIGQPGALTQLLMAMLSTGAAALVLYFWRRRASAAERAFSHQQLRRPVTWGWIFGVAGVVFAGSSAIAWLGRQFGIEPTPTNLPLMQQAMAQFPVFLAVFAIALAPAYEELLFRRVLFGRLWAAGKPVLGLVLSSLAFAFLHEVPFLSDRTMAETAQLWLVYGGMGAAFAGLYWRTGTLWAPVIAHGINNTIALAALYMGA